MTDEIDNLRAELEHERQMNFADDLNACETARDKWKGMYSEAHAINETLRSELAKANRSIERCVKQAFDAESRLETCRAQLATLSLNTPR